MISGKLERVKLLLLDVDGVLTDGRIVYDDRGAEIKTFHVRDGLGLRLLMAAGIGVALVTGRRSQALTRRCDDLGIDEIYAGVAEKGVLLPEILARRGLDAYAAAFVGDDLPDLPIMRRVGLAIAVADAHERVIAAAHMVTARPGGQGAVREICEALLKAQGCWDSIMARF
jgi:3-deoxy-D-manno-octulosonate 8-phosphate phosphatase (KDO 8-P phosphatase)